MERFKNKQTDDGSEVLFDNDFSSIGLFDDTDEIPSAVKRKRLSTLAAVTVGAAQERQDKSKRSIKPTNRLGTNVAMKDRQHLYATESRTYQQNRALLMTPASKTIPDIPAFPVTFFCASKGSCVRAKVALVVFPTFTGGTCSRSVKIKRGLL